VLSSNTYRVFARQAQVTASVLFRLRQVVPKRQNGEARPRLARGSPEARPWLAWLTPDGQ